MTQPTPVTPLATPARPGRLAYLFPGWYAVVMGLCGLSLAWQRAQPLMGEAAGVAAWLAGGLAALVFTLLAGATLLRGLRHPEAWADDRRHPVRHTFIATLPVATLLLATVGTALLGPLPLMDALWWCGSLSQWFVTAWVLGRWWQPTAAGASPSRWVGVTPALFIPVVGNVVAPLAGVPLGHTEWATAQFGVGLLFWPVVLTLLLARVAVQGHWPGRLQGTVFIVIAPPAVVGLALLQLNAPIGAVWACWGMALFSLTWVATQARVIAAQPFGLAHWGLSFPLAALAALTLRLASLTPQLALMSVLGPILLALASLVILGLLLATLRGLRDGSLLAPEPVASLQPTSA